MLGGGGGGWRVNPAMAPHYAVSVEGIIISFDIVYSTISQSQVAKLRAGGGPDPACHSGSQSPARGPPTGSSKRRCT